MEWVGALTNFCCSALAYGVIVMIMPYLLGSNNWDMKKSWITVLLLLVLAQAQAQPLNDSVAIRLLLEKESATWRSGDIAAHAACWQIRPYSRIFISTGDSTVIDVPPAMMLNPPPGSAGKGGYSINTNYKMGITHNTAWVSHHEESVATNGKRTYSYEIRLLEKVKGQWKLVGQSIHIYKPRNE